MNENDEVLDLANADDEVVGKITRGEMVKINYRSPTGYARFAVAFLVNKKGEVWVPIRGQHKVIAPGSADYSVAEHVLSGETYEQAIKRAFNEEAGMDIDTNQLVTLSKLIPTKEKWSFEQVFALLDYQGGDPNFSKEEFASAGWMPIKDFDSLLKSGIKTKSSLPPAFGLLLKYLKASKTTA